MDYHQPYQLLANGELELQLDPHTKFRIKPWAEGLGSYVVQGKNRFPLLLSNPCLISPTSHEIARADHKTFTDNIPEPVRDAVRPFFGMGQVTLLCWAAQWEAAQDLLFSNPVLLWLLSADYQNGGIQSEEIPTLLRKKQRDILSSIIGNTATNRQLKLLRKICIETGSPLEYDMMIYALDSEEGNACIDSLLHQPVVSMPLLVFLLHESDLAQQALIPLFEEWAKTVSLAELLSGYHRAPFELTWPQLAWQCKDTLRTGHTLGIANPADVLGKARSLEDVQRLHDRWMHRMLVTPEQDLSVPDYPPPPLPDAPLIKAIRTQSALAQESREMSHCVQSYSAAIRQGECYIYQVLAPERGTLEVRLTPVGEPCLGQFKLHDNQSPGQASWEYVREWLEYHCKATREEPSTVAG